jgi:simple sugar transport system permease protein
MTDQPRAVLSVAVENTAETTALQPVLHMDERPALRRSLADNVPTTPMAKLRENFRYMRGRGALEISLIYFAMMAAFVAIYIRDSDGFPFLAASNTSGVLSQSIPVLAVLAIGAGLLMIAGEFDLSVGASLGLSAIVFIKIANGHSWILAFLAAVACAMAISLINGLIVIATGIPSFIATLGMSLFWVGASMWINGKNPSRLDKVKNESFIKIAAGDHGRFRSQLIWMVLIGIVMWFILHRHKWGNHIYAVGGNQAAATAVSIRPKLVKLATFATFGALTGVAAVLVVGRTGNMQPGTTGDYTLFAIAAAVVGGCSLTGGRGTVFGMVIGAAFIRTVEDALILGKADDFYPRLFVGLTIVVAAVVNKFMEGRAK